MILKEWFAFKDADIPDRYKKFKKIGSGATSIVLDYSDTEVLMLTKDKYKVKYLLKSGLGEIVDKWEGEPQWDEDNRNSKPETLKFRELTSYALLVPKLYELSYDNEQKLNNVINYLRRLKEMFVDRERNKYSNVYAEAKLQKLRRVFKKKAKYWVKTSLKSVGVDFYNNNTFVKCVEFMEEHMDDIFDNKVRIDLHGGNFMQVGTGEAEIVIVDPVVSLEILNIHDYGKRLSELPYEPTRQIKFDESVLTEAYAVSRRDIPTQYRKRYSYMGSGFTSLVYTNPNDKEEILMFTRDLPKVKWLTYAGIAEVVDKFMVNKDETDNPTYANIPIYVLKMERLRVLDDDNYNKLQTLLKWIGKYLRNVPHAISKRVISKSPEKFQRIVQKFGIQMNDIRTLKKFIEFIYENPPYGDKDGNNKYKFDLRYNNIMQTKDGEIIILDPIVSKELFALAMPEDTSDDAPVDAYNIYNDFRPFKKLNEVSYWDIEKKYKKFLNKYRQLGSGATSKVYGYNEKEVVMFTNDKAKVKYLVQAGLAEIVDTFESTQTIKKLPIYVLIVQKLFDVEYSRGLEKAAESIMQLATNINTRMHREERNPFVKRKLKDKLRVILKSKKVKSLITKLLGKENLEFIDENNLDKFLEFLAAEASRLGYHSTTDYTDQFGIDLHSANIMMNSNGKLVLADPVVTSEVFDGNYPRYGGDYPDTSKILSDEELKQKGLLEGTLELEHIPPRLYDKYIGNNSKREKIGDGHTSLVYEYDNDHILMFTRDRMKIKWLLEAGIAEVIDKGLQDVAKTRGQPENTVKIPIYVLLVEKLTPIKNSNNEKFYNKVEDFIRSIEDVINDGIYGTKKDKRIGSGFRLALTKLIGRKKFTLWLGKFLQKNGINFITVEHLNKFAEFIYKELFYKGFSADLHMGNVMLNKNGELIFSDPIVSSELMMYYGYKPALDHIDFEPTRIVEAAVEQEEIADDYHNLKKISSGSTSQVYEYDQDHVLMFTRDVPKVRWLLHSGLGEELERYKTENEQYSDMPIYVMQVQKLFPLTDEQEDIAWKIESAFMKYVRSSNENKKRISNVLQKNKLKLLLKKVINSSNLDFLNKESYESFVDYIFEYGVESDYSFDLMAHNFLTNKEGEIILADPVICKEILGREFNNTGVPKVHSDGFVFDK